MVTKQNEVLRLFREGMSKSEIGKTLGIGKKQVGALLAKAIKEAGNGKHD